MTLDLIWAYCNCVLATRTVFFNFTFWLKDLWRISFFKVVRCWTIPSRSGHHLNYKKREMKRKSFFLAPTLCSVQSIGLALLGIEGIFFLVVLIFNLIFLIFFLNTHVVKKKVLKTTLWFTKKLFLRKLV